MDRSQIIAENHRADLIARDAAAASRYRSKSPIHGGPLLDEMRQQ